MVFGEREIEPVALARSTVGSTVCFERYGTEQVYEAFVVDGLGDEGNLLPRRRAIEIADCFVQTDLCEEEEDDRCPLTRALARAITEKEEEELIDDEGGGSSGRRRGRRGEEA